MKLDDANREGRVVQDAVRIRGRDPEIPSLHLDLGVRREAGGVVMSIHFADTPCSRAAVYIDDATLAQLLVSLRR